MLKQILDHIICFLNKELGIFLGISIGVVLFVYLFNPFPLDYIDDDDVKLFYVGMGIITFMVMLLVRIFFPSLMEKDFQDDQHSALPSLFSSLFIWVLSIITLSVYIIYAGSVSFSYYLFFKLILICIAPPAILIIYDRINKLKRQNKTLILERLIQQKKIENYKEEYLNHHIEFISGHKTENIHLLIVNILFFKAADNYVEIHFLEDEQVKKTLIRNTLRNIELQCKPFKNFVRCHRNCIINIDHIENVIPFCKDNTLIIKGSHHQIPVSRQYLLKIKEAFNH